MTAERIAERDVRRIAELARLSLSAAEAALLERELGAILAYVEQLGELDTSSVEPFSGMPGAFLPLADDIPEEGVAQATALSQAPRHTNAGFAVPAFVDE